MSYQLTLDPALRCTGVALWYHGRLCDVGIIRVAKLRGPAAFLQQGLGLIEWLRYRTPYGRVTHGFSETMIIRKKAKPGRSKDILQCMGALGALSLAVGPGVVWKDYEPQTWKKTVDKDLMGDRMVGRLSETEQQVLQAWIRETTTPSLAHNIKDAIGVGVYSGLGENGWFKGYE